MNSMCQAYLLKFPQAALLSYTNVEFAVLDLILITVSRYGNHIEMKQAEMAKIIGCRREQVNRSISKFKSLGLINTTRRFYRCCIISITNYFSFPRVRKALKGMFSLYPKFKIKISLLLSEYRTTLKEEDIKEKDLSPVRKEKIYIPLKPSVTNTRDPLENAKVLKKGEILASIDILLQKALEIEAALFARGEKEADVDTAKLCAFSEECLDSVSATMKFAKPKFPFRFFISKCFEWCKSNNIEPLYSVSDFIRAEGLIEKLRPAGRSAKSIKQQIENKQIESARHDKADAYRRDVERITANEERLKAIDKANFEDYKARHPVRLLSQDEKDQVNVSNPFMEIMISAGKKKLAVLDPESHEAKLIREELITWGAL